jgi:predicted small metal-binding protein
MKLACKDINPDTTCDFEVTGNTPTEVAKKMMKHVKSDHAEDVKGMTDAEIMKMLEEKVHD